ncbi:hypothetical protein C1645_737212 [Glomus cerebriforme]|uniref:Uncharacterized protein n=1 Tax=Glomus cerebriforme TaxID=658196 RepID=A0A397T541_9GLOM|nr:hypothetical protein C1645_737212 [Glomus cerebriforme]
MRCNGESPKALTAHQFIRDSEDLICNTEDKQHKVSFRKKRKLDEAFSDDDFDYLYGIVTTGRDCHFPLYSPGEILQSNKMPLSIEFTDDALEEDSEEYQALCRGAKCIVLSNLSSELESLRQQVVELKAENIEVKAENAKLRQVNNEFLDSVNKMISNKIKQRKRENTQSCESKGDNDSAPEDCGKSAGTLLESSSADKQAASAPDSYENADQFPIIKKWSKT